MDRALDEIVAERYKGNRFQGRRSDHRPERKFYPRDGIRKAGCQFLLDDPPSAKLRVENLHYDLTEDDLDDLFNRIGPVKELSLTYDRAGRSEGIAYVTYEQSHYARRAIQEYDGANAKGQPIRLISIPLYPPARRRNPPPPRPRSIFDRVTMPARKSRSFSSFGRNEINIHSQGNVDRYVPGRQTRSRSPQRFRREGRRIGEKSSNGRGAERLARDGRPKKTQEELDAEMDDYWNSKDNNNSLSVKPTQDDVMDEEMIE
ncbi:hypothetical protein EPUL_002101 [Erysiphe pulchra]|uniref:RRM domain-containing protein n=1 Tax=Erysiphe pulchra TaxID=225359 RepID=A0A2S4PVD6_9PEZI|nr:hypothetical protein EPUL_002101 [Erysiphe pulchra]